MSREVFVVLTWAIGSSLVLSQGLGCARSGSDLDCTGASCDSGANASDSDAGASMGNNGSVPPDSGGLATNGPLVCHTDAGDSVCGDSCCSGAEVCVARRCVTPGIACRSSADCDDGEYCEESLGDPAKTPPEETDPSCLSSVSYSGRCLELPPKCEGDDPQPDETCLRTCEYRPQVNKLNAVRQWQWGPTAQKYPQFTDIWSTPTVGRVTDSNCDGAVDELDPPNIVVVSGNIEGVYCSKSDTCKTGVLRVLDGRSGKEVWSLRKTKPESTGFSGVSVALGDVGGDGRLEIVAVTGEGAIAVIDGEGNVLLESQPMTGWTDNVSHGWGGALALADANHDGLVEVAYGRSAWTIREDSIDLLFAATSGDHGGKSHQALSFWVNLDDDPELELSAGRSAYNVDGTFLFNRSDIDSGFSAIGNFDDDPRPEVAIVSNGRTYLLNGEDGSDAAQSLGAPGADPGTGGPPTIADFDGDGQPEIGVAWKNNYQVLEINPAGTALRSLWNTPNHDFSSSVTGSTVFDFEGDGAAEVIYGDECFLWVYDGATGAVKFATPTTSFTATETSLVADVDADGRAEIVMISNGANPDAWKCTLPEWLAPDETIGRPGWVGSDGARAPYRGITVWRDAANSWVGTRTLWNQHAYSVSNVCGDPGDACEGPSSYGEIPQEQVANWKVPFLNNFRQNVQGEGLFDAPDASVVLDVTCTAPSSLRASVRNLGAAQLPEGVTVEFLKFDGTAEVSLGLATTQSPLSPGQTEALLLPLADAAEDDVTYRARIVVDPEHPTFRECREDNNEAEAEDVCPLLL